MRYRLPQRPGFALVEVVVAMVILAVSISTLAALMVQIARGSLRVSGDSYRNAVYTYEINRLESIPYDSLAVGVQTVTVSTRPYPHTRTITVTEPMLNVRKVQVVIVPTRAYFLRDSVVVYRRRPRSTNALYTTLL